MTTSATILGALPLASAAGAGAASRRQIGVVLIGGLVVSTIVTLFLVPAWYAIVSRRHRVWSGGAAEREESAGASLLPSRSS